LREAHLSGAVVEIHEIESGLIACGDAAGIFPVSRPSAKRPTFKRSGRPQLRRRANNDACKRRRRPAPPKNKPERY
jgi:hypothetical protein